MCCVRSTLDYRRPEVKHSEAVENIPHHHHLSLHRLVCMPLKLLQANAEREKRGATAVVKVTFDPELGIGSCC